MILRYLPVIKAQSFDAGYEVRVTSRNNYREIGLSASGRDNSHSASSYRRRYSGTYTASLNVNSLPAQIIVAVEVKRIFEAVIFSTCHIGLMVKYSK